MLTWNNNTAYDIHNNPVFRIIRQTSGYKIWCVDYNGYIKGTYPEFAIAVDRANEYWKEFLCPEEY